ncbi:MAG TPA: CHAD domain-containing protein, partial [Croceibacterium sp.]
RLRRELARKLTTGWPGIPGESRAADQPVAAFASASLDRLGRKVGKKGRRFRSLDDDDLHELRIATKKLRYAIEFFAGLFTSAKAQGREARSLQALRELQDRLGDVQDIAVAPALLVRALVPRAEWPALPPRKRLVERARETYGRALAVKPFWR